MIKFEMKTKWNQMIEIKLENINYKRKKNKIVAIKRIRTTSYKQNKIKEARVLCPREER